LRVGQARSAQGPLSRVLTDTGPQNRGFVLTMYMRNLKSVGWRLARFGWKAGLAGLVERAPQRPGICALAYHRVGHAEVLPYDRQNTTVTPEMFDAQVAFLKRLYPIATLEEVLDLYDHPRRLKHFHVLITFDDGYLDNYEAAYPILRSHSVQGTFFLPTGLIGTSIVPWWERIAYAVRHSKKLRLELLYPEPCSLDLGTMDVESVIACILRIYKVTPGLDTQRFLGEVERACESGPPPEPAVPFFMNWSQASEMARNGMAFGSHTHRHEILSRLPIGEQDEELAGSRTIIAERLGRPPDALAFPVGTRDTFSEATMLAAERAGYKLAFSCYGGLNTPRNLNRLNVLRRWVGTLSLDAFRVRLVGAAALQRWLG
jgi:peptidoglycan/xylan/chitin deacetylase (PgdA/CDA1 family)